MNDEPGTIEYVKPSETFYFHRPPESKWIVSLTKDYYAQLHLPTAPNIFYRWMQRICLGIYWKKK